ncbi:hypothetical protein HK099_003007, partial [Clydaea vesicula]
TNSYGEIYGLRSAYDVCLVLWYKRTPIEVTFITACTITISGPTSFMAFAYYKIYKDVKDTGKKLNACFATTQAQSKLHDQESNDGKLSILGTDSVVGDNLNSKNRLHKDQADLEKIVLLQSISICFCFIVGWIPVIVIVSHEVISGTSAPVWLLHLNSFGPAFTCL